MNKPIQKVGFLLLVLDVTIRAQEIPL